MTHAANEDQPFWFSGTFTGSKQMREEGGLKGGGEKGSLHRAPVTNFHPPQLSHIRYPSCTMFLSLPQLHHRCFHILYFPLIFFPKCYITLLIKYIAPLLSYSLFSHHKLVKSNRSKYSSALHHSGKSSNVFLQLKLSSGGSDLHRHIL